MGPVFYGLGSLCFLGSLVCFVLVLIQMFKREKTALAIACSFCFSAVGSEA
jgi:hypothetical protein